VAEGFGIASRLRGEHQAGRAAGVIAGTLAYMAPEQTGRVNARWPPQAISRTGYHLLRDADGDAALHGCRPMEWVHCHIARQPVPPNERVADVPGPLSAIVMRSS